MDDLIERDAALARIDCCLGNSLGGRKEFDSGLMQARKFVLSTPAVNRWIPCSERLPEKHVEVLAYSPYWGKIVVAMWGGEYWLEQWTDDDLEQSEITHWMPLPEPPESEAQEDDEH